MEQYNIEILKIKKEETLKKVKTQINELRIAREHVTHLDAQLRKVQKRYEILDRKIFEAEHEKRIAQEREEATRKATTKKSSNKSTNKSLSAKLNNILADMTEEELKALIAKHI